MRPTPDPLASRPSSRRHACVLTAGFPPIALMISIMSMLGDSMPLILSVLGLLAMLFALFKYREKVGKMLIFVVRKVTRSKRR